MIVTVFNQQKRKVVVPGMTKKRCFHNNYRMQNKLVCHCGLALLAESYVNLLSFCVAHRVSSSRKHEVTTYAVQSNGRGSLVIHNHKSAWTIGLKQTA